MRIGIRDLTAGVLDDWGVRDLTAGVFEDWDMRLNCRSLRGLRVRVPIDYSHSGIRGKFTLKIATKTIIYKDFLYIYMEVEI